MSSQNSALKTPSPNQSVVKAIVFRIANHWFALPLMTIDKIIHCPPQVNQQDKSATLLHWEQQTITVLNLHSYLADGSQESESSEPTEQFFLLTHTPQGEICALRVDELPNLLDLPLAAVEQLPKSFREHKLLDLASYMAVLAADAQQWLVFLLNLEQTFNLLLAKG